MSDKKKGKQKTDDEEKVTKEEYAVAKYLRFGLPVREGKMHGMEVKCFIASVAIDKLLESKWSVSKNATEPLFTTRATCIAYMNELLAKGLFHKADRDKKRKEKESSKKKKKEKETTEKEEPSGEDEVRQRKSKKEKKSKTEKDDKSKPDNENKEEKKKDEKKKKEKRLKLLMSDNQWFEDGDEVYVWIYDPVNAKTFVIGLLMVLGAIGLCMFPLWPEEVRIGVYYLSLAAAGFVGFILFLAVARLILFCIVWTITIGRHHFWLLPNLTEDVGFFDSFRPLYHHESVTKDGGGEADKADKKKKKKKSSDSKKEKSDSSSKQTEKSSDKDDSEEFEVIKKEDLDENNEAKIEERNNDNNIGDEEDEEEDLNEESEDYDEDTQNNSASEKEDKKTQ